MKCKLDLNFGEQGAFRFGSIHVKTSKCQPVNEETVYFKPWQDLGLCPKGVQSPVSGILN